ncbi:MAG: sensor histidine kinase, partial [Ktedonobacteraceae bacterium]
MWLLLLLQLAFSYLVVGIIANATSFVNGGAIILFWLAAGLLLTFNLVRNLHALTTALEKLADKTSLKPLSLRWRGPLTPLFRLLNTLAQGAGKQGQLTQQTVEYRDQLLQQVGKTAAQEERNRLARDLHDSIKQQIFSIAVSTAAVKVRWESDPISARKTIGDIEITAHEAQVEMQALLQQLRPVALENVGLVESLRMQCQALGYRTGAQVTSELGELPADEQVPLG